WAVGTIAALGLGVVVLAGAFITTLGGPRTGSLADSAPAAPVERRNEAERRVESLPLSPQRTTSFARSIADDSGSGPASDDLAAAARRAGAAGGTRRRDAAPARGASRPGSGDAPLAEAAPLGGAGASATRSPPAAPAASVPPVEPLPEPYHVAAAR